RTRSVSQASVMTAASQELRVSRDRSARGRTASERIRAIRAPGRARPSQSPGFASNRMATTPATSDADHHTLGRPRVGGLERVGGAGRSEEHTSELQSRFDLVCRLLLEKKK